MLSDNQKKIFILILYTLILSLLFSCKSFSTDECKNAVSATPEMVKVQFMHSLNRLTKFQDFKPKETIQISGARNEWVNFQIAVRAENAFIEDLKLEITNFKNDQGSTIDSTCFIKYREHFIDIEKSSPESSLSPGWYPDALIPFNDPEFGSDLHGKYDATPHELKCGENAIYYIECQIPDNCSTGNYEGKVILRWAEYQKLEYLIKLKIFNFSIPKNYIMVSSFGGTSDRFKELYAQDLDKFQNYFEEILLKHRVQPSKFYSVVPKIEQESGNADFSKVHHRMQYLLDTLKIKYFQIPFYEDWPFVNNLYMYPLKTVNFLKSYENYFMQNGWNANLYIYLIDEPKEEEFYKVRDIYNILVENELSIKQLVTLNVIPQGPQWGGLAGAVDIWTPLFQYYDEFLMSNTKVDSDLVWVYTALCQKDKGNKITPYWQIDFPLLNHRIPLWIMYKTNTSGLLYWNTTYWNYTDDPWTNSLTYSASDVEFNGEGSLLYPGNEVGFSGLCPSLRLKTIRDGVEDYYYLIYADSLGLLNNTMKDVVTSWSNWNEDPNSLLKMREYIGDLISNAQ